MPGPPPPPPSVGRPGPPPKSSGRTNLLSSIEGFKKGKLKKSKTVDKSSALPASSGAVGNASSGASSSSGSSGTSQYAAAPMQAMGGLFAGGVPSLRKTGRPGAATMLSGLKTISKETPTTGTPKKEESKEIEKKTIETSTTATPVTPVPKSVAPISSTPKLALEKSLAAKLAPPEPEKVVESVPSAVVLPVASQTSPQTNSVTPIPQQNTKPGFIPPIVRTSSVLSYTAPERSNRSSLLPKVSYNVDLSFDGIEEHPSIPSYHNPLSATLKERSASVVLAPVKEEKKKEETLRVETFTPLEGAMEYEEEEELLPPANLLPSSSLVVETLSFEDMDRPKAACELQPKRQELMTASREGDIDTVMNLLQKEQTQMRKKELLNGLSLDNVSNKETSPLHIAIEEGHLAMVATLLSQGANALFGDAIGNTAIHTVCKTQHSTTMEIFEFLMKTACNVKAQNNEGDTPLHIACQLHERKTAIYPEMVYSLVTNPFADLLVQNNHGITALMYAAQSGDLGVVKLIVTRLSPEQCVELLNMYGTLNSRTVNAVTLASDRSTVGEITKLLMEYGAEPSPLNSAQTSLGPLLCHISVPPSTYPSNRLARILSAECIVNPASDEDAVSCLQCEIQFGIVTRRHHCRSCGMVYCDKCSSFKQRLLGKNSRVCSTCNVQIGWHSPIQLVSSQYFIQRESEVYRNELERYDDDSVRYIIEQYDAMNEIQDAKSLLPEATWETQRRSATPKLDDAFTVSKLPTTNHLPSDSYCSLFEFAAMCERLHLISAYCLDIHDIVDQEEVSLDDEEKFTSITESQQRATLFILIAVGAQVYSIVSRLSENAVIFKFLDSSYYKIRMIIQFISELKGSPDSEANEFSFSAVDHYSLTPLVPGTVSSVVENDIVPEVEEREVSIEEEDTVGVEKPGIFSKLFRRDSQVVKSSLEDESNSKLTVATIDDIEPLGEDFSDEEESTEITEPAKPGFFSNLFTRKPSQVDVGGEGEDQQEIPAEPTMVPPEEPEEEVVSPSGSRFSKWFGKKVEETVTEEESTLDDELPLPPSYEPPTTPEESTEVPVASGGIFSKLFGKKTQTDAVMEEESPVVDDLTLDEEPVATQERSTPIIKFFKSFSSSADLVSLEDEDEVETTEIEEPEKPSGVFSWFSRKKEIPAEKGDFVPAPSPDLELEDDLFEVPATRRVPKAGPLSPVTKNADAGAPPPPPPSSGPPAPPPTQKKKTKKGAASGDGRGALLSSIEGFSKGGLKKASTNDRSTSNAGSVSSSGPRSSSRPSSGIDSSPAPKDLMSEMRNALQSGNIVKVLPSVTNADLAKARKFSKSTTKRTVSPVPVAKPLPTPAAKRSPTSVSVAAKPLPNPVSKKLPTPKKKEVKPTPPPSVDDVLFGSSQSNSDTDLFASKPKVVAPVKKRPTPPPKAVEEPEEDDFFTSKPKAAAKTLPTPPPKAAVLEKKLPTPPPKALEEPEEDDFFTSKPKATVLEKNLPTPPPPKALEEPEEDDFFTPKAAAKTLPTPPPKAETVKPLPTPVKKVVTPVVDPDLFGMDTETDFFVAKKKKPANSKGKGDDFFGSSSTKKSTSSVFGVSDDFDGLGAVEKENDIFAPKTTEPESSALFHFDKGENTENSLFSSTSKPKTSGQDKRKASKASLFDDDEDLFSF